MADRPVQVDQQPRGRGRMERRGESVGHLAGEFERTRIPAAVAVEQRLQPREECRVGRRNLTPAMLAGDDEKIFRPVKRQTPPERGLPGACLGSRRSQPRRRRANPSPAKPSPSSASVPGSGTAPPTGTNGRKATTSGAPGVLVT